MTVTTATSTSTDGSLEGKEVFALIQSRSRELKKSIVICMVAF